MTGPLSPGARELLAQIDQHVAARRAALAADDPPGPRLAPLIAGPPPKPAQLPGPGEGAPAAELTHLNALAARLLGEVERLGTRLDGLAAELEGLSHETAQSPSASPASAAPPDAAPPAVPKAATATPPGVASPAASPAAPSPHDARGVDPRLAGLPPALAAVVRLPPHPGGGPPA